MYTLRVRYTREDVCGIQWALYEHITHAFPCARVIHAPMYRQTIQYAFTVNNLVAYHTGDVIPALHVIPYYIASLD